MMEKKYKRPFDLGILLLAHLLPFPLLLSIALWTVVPFLIWLEDRGPVFYRQKRIGKDGKIFTVIKFRTMRVDAEKATGAVWATANDPRVTRVGRMLRATHIDELPQVINILKGEMSLVGPRPERPEIAEKIALDVPDFEKRLCVRPGVTGLAQAVGVYDLDPSQKLRHDMEYVHRMSLHLDVLLLFLSVWTTLTAIKKRPSKGPGLETVPKLSSTKRVSRRS